MMFGCRGGPGTADPGRLTCTNANLGMLMMRAYGVQSYQITSPDWFNSERFDITAKVADGATKEQLNLMLQNLLAERFQVKLTLGNQRTADLRAGGRKGRPEGEAIGGNRAGNRRDERCRATRWASAAPKTWAGRLPAVSKRAARSGDDDAARTLAHGRQPAAYFRAGEDAGRPGGQAGTG